MVLRPIDLDSDMTAAEVLDRLARNGLWLDPSHPAVRRRVEPLANRARRPFEDLVKILQREPSRYGAAIRRQYRTEVLWYTREIVEVLERCSAALPQMLLLDVLHLHETDSRPPIEVQELGDTLLRSGVVLDRGHVVGVSVLAVAEAGTALDLDPPHATQPRPYRGDTAAFSRSAGDTGRSSPAVVETWPRIDAPDYQPAGDPFDVVVGFAATRQSGVNASIVRLPVAQGIQWLDVVVELSAGKGVLAPEGWSRPLRIPVNDATSARATFRLVGVEPTNRERAWLTMLEVRYVLDGTVCGTAARPLVVLPALPPAGQIHPAPSTGWIAAAPTPTALNFVADTDPPDLTIEITKPDRNAASGAYQCRLYTPHALITARGPFDVDLGQDAKTFAKQLVEEVRLFANSELLDGTLEAIGRLVADRLPQAVFEALHAIAAQARATVPSVLIVSAEPYVPWELAWMDAPLDATRPSFLGAQALVGRWLRDSGAATQAASATGPLQRPALHPNSTLEVRNVAVMAAWYRTESGLRRLPSAEAEATAIVEHCQAVALAASQQSMRQLLNATIERQFETVGRVEAVHFAGHGDFDPTLPDGSALFLNDGTPLRSTLFRSAKYGGEHQPLLFLNACMLGVGGELLGDMAGFPGNSLRGGFGAVLGALWEVDDTVAHDIAIEFWSRALPEAPARGEPIGSILRDLRARYVHDAPPAPISTYLAYVYYGHPRLTLARA